jgi:hypothetical protein
VIFQYSRKKITAERGNLHNEELTSPVITVVKLSKIEFVSMQYCRETRNIKQILMSSPNFRPSSR